MKSPNRPTVLLRLDGTSGTGAAAATLLAWEDSYVTLLTRGSEIVGIEVMPICGIGDYSPEFAQDWISKWSGLLPDLDGPVDTQATASLLERLIDLAPLTTAVEKHQMSIPRRFPLSKPRAFPVELTESALDAFTYDQARTQGKSPRQAVSTQRGVPSGTAAGRIRRARERGLLTWPEHTRALSMLTERAADVLAGELGERPYPYVKEDGEIVYGPNE